MHQSSEFQNIVSIQTARSRRVAREHEAAGTDDTLRAGKAGGFIRDGKDNADHDLMTTRAGLNALQIFARIGGLSPVYLSQEYFDSIR